MSTVVRAESHSHSQASAGGCGCFSVIALVLLVWALCFGVTWNGKHHGVSCSCDHGVEVQ